MVVPATYAEITSFLKKIPAASPSWAEGIYSAGLSLDVMEKLVVTMTHDPGSPLRKSEEGILHREILRINQERGSAVAKGTVVGKLNVKVKVVLSASEQTRVVRATSGFVQPSFEATSKFGRNGHAVMNAVRRLLTAYITSKVPVGGSVVEVGPDVTNWLLSPTPSQWSGRRIGNYSAARPVIGPRDSVRVKWDELSELVGRARDSFFSEDVRTKVKLVEEGYNAIFKNTKIQSGEAKGEYILSFDSNYDIGFSDMPIAMSMCRARAWYGVMVRAKGLTRDTRLTDGALDVLGVNYHVDWKAGRIDFRHPECTAFGYSHAVWEYMKYEEYNGYVWTTKDCHYIYSKGPETTSELLFFQVVRVPKVHRMMEPRFVENPYEGLLELTSLWAVGDEVNGVPKAFEKVVFHVDALNFSKVLEKRRSLDYKGDLAITVSLVRSTNVRLWLHGTPVSANKRIEAKLADATAVVVEALAAENRLNSNSIFEKAMFQYDLSMARPCWLRRMLEAVIDMQAVTGKVAGPVMRVWNGIRAAIIDKALSPLAEVKVGVSKVSDHIKLTGSVSKDFHDLTLKPIATECVCAEIAEVRAAIKIASGDDVRVLEDYLLTLEGRPPCDICVLPLDAIEVSSVADQSAEESVTQVNSGSSTDASCGSTTDSDGDTDITDYAQYEVGKAWSDVQHVSTCESRAMQEFVDLETYLADACKVEVRIDSARIFSRGPISDTLLNEFCTTRTKHVVLEFLSGRCVKTFGPGIGPVSALYDMRRDEIVDVRCEGNVMYAPVIDGYYYSCNRLRIWNGPALAKAVEYAMTYGVVSRLRDRYKVVLGVPGAGKTYMMMKGIADRWHEENFDFLVLSTTRASVKSARKFGRQFHLPDDILAARVMTVDRYLMHSKMACKDVYFDEFPMNHIAKVDASASIAAAVNISLFGDARQIPYDPFCAEFRMQYATLGSSVKEANVQFLPKSHRLSADVCAMWLDQYPNIYPCDCCNKDNIRRSTCEVIRVVNLDDLRYDGIVRFHTYKQDEKDELRVMLKMPGDADALRALEVGGLSTVHEDQGSTHREVVTVRLSSDYDKNESPRNPSLYNRERYVLTDTTRHTHSYKYYTMCAEDDLICKRIRMAADTHRLGLVEEKKGLGDVSIIDML